MKSHFFFFWSLHSLTSTRKEKKTPPTTQQTNKAPPFHTTGQNFIFFWLVLRLISNLPIFTSNLIVFPALLFLIQHANNPVLWGVFGVFFLTFYLEITSNAQKSYKTKNNMKNNTLFPLPRFAYYFSVLFHCFVPHVSYVPARAHTHTHTRTHSLF